MPAPEREPGIYQLHLRLREPVRIPVGRLGTFDFPAGAYVYTGSALGGLQRRIERHRRQAKRLHWHIDYLLIHAAIERVLTFPTREPLECDLNRRTVAETGARVVVRGFGSSDCRCESHLLYLESGAGTVAVPGRAPG
jgi:Uri superfamily endonuclease